MLASKVVANTVAKRNFSTQSPRVQIVNGFLKLRAIRQANNDTAINAALGTTYSDASATMPKEAKEAFEGYLASAPSADKFVADPTHWQNQPFFSYIIQEVKRPYVWPFMVGVV